MISGVYTSTEKAGRLFFKRTAAFFREDSDWDAGLLARAPKDIVRRCFPMQRGIRQVPVLPRRWFIQTEPPDNRKGQRPVC